MSENATENWFDRINALMRRHRQARDGVLVRFGASRYPFPCVSIQVFSEGEKITEYPITNIEALIEDLTYAKDILKEVYLDRATSGEFEERRRNRRRREDRDEREEDYEDEEYEEESEERRRSDRRSTRSRRRRAPRRD